MAWKKAEDGKVTDGLDELREKVRQAIAEGHKRVLIESFPHDEKDKHALAVRCVCNPTCHREGENGVIIMHRDYPPELLKGESAQLISTGKS